jgi:hypothetical protein
MADDLASALRALANHWAMKARDYARAAKEEGSSEAQASYNRGFAEGYYRAATELAALVNEQGSAREPQPKPVSSAPSAGASQPRPAAKPPASPAAPAAPSAPPKPQVVYASITVGEALSVLEFAGLAARDVTQNKDNSFRAIFSRWENMMPHERVERIQKADNRIIILNSGKLESHDHFVEFAFKETSPS